MDKASFYGIEWEELDRVRDYLKSRSYILRDEEDSSISIYENDRLVGEIVRIGGLVFTGRPNINIEDRNSGLEKVLDEFMGRDSPSASPQSSRSSNSGA